jgi:hypothetical protein
MAKNHFPAYRAPFQVANVGEKHRETHAFDASSVS